MTTGLWLRVAMVGAVVLLQSLGTVQAHAAVVPNPPVFPPTGIVPGPPPIPAMPAAGNVTPPADQISDPVTPAATCGSWNPESNYGGRLPAGSTWWEYSCGYANSWYYNACPGPGACDAFCPNCYWDTQEQADYFFWDGSEASFYGQADNESVVYDGGDSYSTSSWWDGPTAKWYSLGPYALTVSKQGTGSGDVSSSPAGISCGYACQASFDAGTLITLSPMPDGSSTFTGWSGDCSGTGSCHVDLDQARTVTATFALNASPHASFTAGCTGLSVNLDAGNSTDPGGTIQDYYWTFGDQKAADAGGNTKTQHIYPQTGTYIVTLTVTDNLGARSTAAQAVSVINQPPTVEFAFSCAKFICSFGGGSSTDIDGAIQAYSWSFGDGATAVGAAVQHTYALPGAYTVSLTITDNAGATATRSQTATVINLNAKAYRSKGHQQVDLSWTGSSATSFDVYRNGTKIATISGSGYTDTLNTLGGYAYQVCNAGSTTCSNVANVSV